MSSRTMFVTQEGPANALALNKDYTQVVIAGRNVFKVFSIEEDEFVENCNLRVGKNLNLNFSCNDVAWNTIEGRVLQCKWKSLRDCFSRECQRLAKTKSGSAASRKTEYVFYNQLYFLPKVIKGKATSSNMEEASAAEIPSGGEEATTISSGSSVEHGHKRKKVENVSPDVEQLVNVLQAGIQSREESEKSKEEDGERLFLLSLLNPMEQIPEHLRFSVCMQIMQVIQNAS